MRGRVIMLLLGCGACLGVITVAAWRSFVAPLPRATHRLAVAASFAETLAAARALIDLNDNRADVALARHADSHDGFAFDARWRVAVLRDDTSDRVSDTWGDSTSLGVPMRGATVRLTRTGSDGAWFTLAPADGRDWMLHLYRSEGGHCLAISAANDAPAPAAADKTSAMGF